jgi:hypothetical protein
MVQNLDTLHGAALHADAVLEDLQHQSTGHLTELRLSIHAYTGPDTSGLNAVFAQRLDEILAERS